MARQSIPAEVKQQAMNAVERFNQEVFSDYDIRYVPRFKGSCLYLDREVRGRLSRICRLRWTGSFDDWEFSIFKYSSEKYDPDEFFHPGVELVDGTIEGAMKAGLEAYPE